MSLNRYLVTSSNVAFLTAIFGKEEFTKHIKALKIEDIYDVQKLCLLLRKYIRLLSSLKIDNCLATPLSGVAPFLAKGYGLNLITNLVMVAAERPRPTDPYCISCLAFDSSTWITKMFRFLGRCFPVDEIPLKFIVYYDPVDQWSILIKYVPIIIMIDFNSILSITKCRDVSITQFTGFRIFKDVLHDVESVESIIATPYRIDENSFQSGDCNPITCLDSSKATHYSYNSEYDFFERHASKSFEESGNIDELFIEIWSSHISLESTNRRVAYIWFFKPKQHVIAQIASYVRNIHVKEIKMVLPYKPFAELGALHSDRIWLSSIVKNVVINSRPRIKIFA